MGNHINMLRFRSILGKWRGLLLLARSLQLFPTLCDPIDGSPPGSPVPGILQARTLKWVASSFSNAWKWKVKVKTLSRVRPSVTPWTAAHQAPPSMGFSRQEYWSRVPLPSPSPQVTNTIIWIKKDETPNHPTPRYEEEKLKFYINLLLLLPL